MIHTNHSNNPTLYLMRGVPGSGKSTLAKKLVSENPNMIRINNDELRETEFNKKISPSFEFSKLEEAKLKQIRLEIITSSIKKGLDVIVDNVNISNHLIRGYLELAKKLGCQVRVIDLSEVPLKLCLERNELRGNSKVPRKVIIGLHETMIKNQDEFNSLNILPF